MRTLCRLVVLLLACLPLLACPTRPLPTAKDDLPDGNRRLGREVVPRRYALDLRIDPDSDRFSGTAIVEVELQQQTRRIAMHAQGLDLRQAAIERAGRSRELSFREGPNGALLLESEASLPPGPASLHFAWSAPLPEAPHGLYRVEDGGRWYAFTQFEPLEARRVFPGFDQPDFKTPFAVTLRVPAGRIALANAPLEREEADGDERVFVFRETRPLPTYLVAFAVGDFDVVDGGGEAPPIRVITTEGKGRLAGWALERTPRIVSRLVDYFDEPFPFAKLDLVAVPNFGAGAMENVGLVTFRERLLLVEGDPPPIWSRYASQSVIAHELSHMWFGDLVTMPWWDDLWLNESFATWMSAKLLEDLDPALDSRLDAILAVQGTLDLDSRRSARQIRQPIHDGGDVYNAFDAITYGKGAAVLRMIESWIGEESFREGVRAYMDEHAYGSGGTDELTAALEQASGQPVGEVLDGFLDQPGAPLVEASLQCPPQGRPSLRLKQTRYLPAGSDAPVGRPWKIPVCVALGTGDPERPRARECVLLEGREQQMPISLDHCPTFVHPNAGERGYYRFRLPPDQLVALVDEHRGQLEDAELVAIPGHYRALLEAEAIPVADLLTVLRILATHPRRQVVGAVTDVWWTLYRAGIPDPDSPAAEAFAGELRDQLGPRLDRIGVLPQPGDSADARLLRGSLVQTLAVLGRDPWIRSRARSVARDFLARPDAADEEVLGMLLPVAAREGDELLWEGLVAVLSDPPSPGVRDVVVHALGSFGDPALLRRSLDLLLDGRLRAQDYRTVTAAIGRDQRPVAWEWLTERHAELLPRLGPMSASGLPGIASGLCSLEDAARVEAFFSGVEAPPPGTRRNVGLVVEEISRCARLRASIDSALARALAANRER